MVKKEPYPPLFDCVNRPELQPNKKVQKVCQMLGTFYLMKLAYFYNNLVLMTINVCAEISERDFEATKTIFSTLTVNIFDSV